MLRSSWALALVNGEAWRPSAKRALCRNDDSVRGVWLAAGKATSCGITVLTPLSMAPGLARPGGRVDSRCRVFHSSARGGGNEEKSYHGQKQLGHRAQTSDPIYPPLVRVSHGKRAPGTPQLRQRDKQVGGGKLGVKARQVLECS